MLTLDERVQVTEERVDKLESIFGHFMAQTGAAMLRLDRIAERMEKTMAEMKRDAEQDRAEWSKRFEDDRKDWNKRWGELAHKLGTIVEDIVAPNMSRVARDYFGCAEIQDFMVRRWVRSKTDRSKRREFDVIVVADDKVIINDTKATPRLEYVDEFIRVLGELDDYLPEYTGKTIIPVFSSLYLGEDVIAYLTKRNIYAMALGDETMQVVNFQQVQEQVEKLDY
jgi:hypothetical protein